MLLPDVFLSNKLRTFPSVLLLYPLDIRIQPTSSDGMVNLKSTVKVCRHTYVFIFHGCRVWGQIFEYNPQNLSFKVRCPPSSQLDTNLRSAVLTAMHTELHSVYKRSNNIVITGMKPSNLASDAVQFKELSSHELKLDLPIRSAVRLGVPIQGRIQPLLVCLGSPEEANAVMSAARDLRRSSSKVVRDYIYINRHQTRAEREAAFNARATRRLKNNSTFQSQPSTSSLNARDVTSGVTSDQSTSKVDTIPASVQPSTSSA